jgi:hypothetical protein
MIRSIIITLALLICATANAGVYSDDMARCLVTSTSPKDKTDLVRWIFANASLHPDVAGIARVTDATRDKLNREVASLLEKLVTDTCRKQSQDAFRYEGRTAFEQSFSTLGQVAMRELMSDKTVSAGFAAFTKYLDKEKLEAIGKQQ